MWIVAGLGNPGKQYLYTWHNMGYLAVDMLADKHGIFLGKEKYYTNNKDLLYSIGSSTQYSTMIIWEKKKKHQIHAYA